MSELKGHVSDESTSWVLLAVAGLLVSCLTACGGGRLLNPATPIARRHRARSRKPLRTPAAPLETFSQTQVDNTNPFFTAVGNEQPDVQQLSCCQRRMEHHPGEPAAALPIHPGRGPDISCAGRRQLPQRRRLYSLGSQDRGLQPAAEFRADPDDAAGAGERRVQHHRHHRSLPMPGNHGDPTRRSTGGRFLPPI